MDRSTYDVAFLATVHAWLEEQGELLILRRYSRMAGSKDWYLPQAPEQLEFALSAPPDTSVIVLRYPQLPVRGIADHRLVDEACQALPDGEGLFILRIEPDEGFGRSWTVYRIAESHAELRELLTEESIRGYEVTIGLEPPWLADSEDVVEAIVPRPDGTVVRGVY